MIYDEKLDIFFNYIYNSLYMLNERHSQAHFLHGIHIIIN